MESLGGTSESQDKFQDAIHATNSNRHSTPGQHAWASDYVSGVGTKLRLSSQ